MDCYKDTLEFVYLNRVIKIPYTMDWLGGSAHVYITDNRGVHHTFFYRSSTKSWHLSGNYKLKWPDDFMSVLFAAFDIERERWGLD